MGSDPFPRPPHLNPTALGPSSASRPERALRGSEAPAAPPPRATRLFGGHLSVGGEAGGPGVLFKLGCGHPPQEFPNLSHLGGRRQGEVVRRRRRPAWAVPCLFSLSPSDKGTAEGSSGRPGSLKCVFHNLETRGGANGRHFVRKLLWFWLREGQTLLEGHTAWPI